MDPKHPESEVPSPSSMASTEPCSAPEGCEQRATMPPGDGEPPEGLAIWERGLDKRFKDIREFLTGELADFEERIADRFEELATRLAPAINRALQDSDTERRLAAAEAELASLRAHCRACPSHQASNGPPNGGV